MISKQAYKCLLVPTASLLPSASHLLASFSKREKREKDNKKLYDFTLIFLACHRTTYELQRAMGKPSKVFISESFAGLRVLKNNSFLHCFVLPSFR